MPDGSVVHSFVRGIASNHVTGVSAAEIAVLSISEPDEEASYAEIAQALAADYYNIFVVDLDTDKFTEYSSKVGEEIMAVERQGEDFFASSRRDAYRIYEEDREIFYLAFSKENILQALEQQGSFTARYRLMDTGQPVFMHMKATRLPSKGNRIIIAVSNINAQMKQNIHFEELQIERDKMMQIMALSDGYLSLFTVDLDTDHYIEFSSSDDYDSLGIAKEGEDFFRQSINNAKIHFHPEDIPTFSRQFTKENVIKEIQDHGSFMIRYRLMIKGEPNPVVLKAAPFNDGEKDKLVVGVREWKERKE
jgi:hypothetical protein